MKIRATVKGGGAVLFNSARAAWASFNVHPGLFYTGVKLPDGRRVTTFVNTETGLICVDVIDKGGNSGTEVFRRVI
jgi:hypothetical protein